MEPYNGFKVGDIVRAIDNGKYVHTSEEYNYVGEVVELYADRERDDIAVKGVSSDSSDDAWIRIFPVNSKYFELVNKPSEDDKFLDSLFGGER